MTKHEIEQAAKEFSKQEYNGDEPVYDDEDLFWQQICYKRGAEMVNERQPYSAEDLASFGRYVKKNWTVIDSGGWVEINTKFYKPHDIKTDKQVIKLWKETK